MNDGPLVNWFRIVAFRASKFTCLNLRLFRSINFILWVIYPVFHFNFRRDIHIVVCQMLSIIAQHKKCSRDCHMVVYCSQEISLLCTALPVWQFLLTGTYTYYVDCYVYYCPAVVLCIQLHRRARLCIIYVTRCCPNQLVVVMEMLKGRNFLFLLRRGQGCVWLTICLTSFRDIFLSFLQC